MSYSRTVRAITKRKSERALRNYLAATEALDTGVSLRLSNLTNIAKGTIHSGLANKLRRSGRYETFDGLRGERFVQHKAYGRGVALAKDLQERRAKGEDPDVRWPIADANKLDGFNAFMKGFNDALNTLAEEEADGVTQQ